MGAHLICASLQDTNFSCADLRETDLSSTDLRNANFAHAKVGWTNFNTVDLSCAKGLETVDHLGPSSIGIDTIYRSEGQIPEGFLRKAGVPETFITYLYALVESMSPIDFYTCFISYSSKNQIFAERLYVDLQSRGVRCWFAPEDLKTGDKIRPRIDESIRLYDKLLLVLSEHSVASQWVEQEVETALAKERKENQTVLFPIRLDKTVMNVEVGWSALIRNTRSIGDFTRWKHHDTYQKALDRLLQDLKAET
jgi:hypothetical protein